MDAPVPGNRGRSNSGIPRGRPSSTTAPCRASRRSAMPVTSSSSSVKRWPTREAVLDGLRAWAAAEARQGPELQALGYFGSYARGDEGFGSDLDLIAVVAHSPLPFMERARDWKTETLPVPADLLVYTWMNGRRSETAPVVSPACSRPRPSGSYATGTRPRKADPIESHSCRSPRTAAVHSVSRPMASVTLRLTGRLGRATAATQACDRARRCVMRNPGIR